MYKLTKNGVIRLSDGALIPENSENADWITYQAWLSEGNAPDEADPEPAINIPLTSYEFLKRFTRAERIAIRSSIDVYVMDFVSLTWAAQIVDFSDVDTLAGMAYLVTNGLLTEARKIEILS